jgi:hypothetical protein
MGVNGSGWEWMGVDGSGWGWMLDAVGCWMLLPVGVAEQRRVDQRVQGQGGQGGTAMQCMWAMHSDSRYMYTDQIDPMSL